VLVKILDIELFILVPPHLVPLARRIKLGWIQQVINFLVIDLDKGAVQRRFCLRLFINDLIQFAKAALHQPVAVHVILNYRLGHFSIGPIRVSLHCIGFPGSGLSIREDRHVEPLHYLTDELVDPSLFV
jgi:hypothetical protein